MTTIVYVPIGNDCITIVDLEDYNLATSAKWYGYRNKLTYYAKRFEGPENKRKAKGLHREIIGAKQGEIVDHINHDGLDNRRCNLRIVTSQQNSLNRRTKPFGSSKYRGVCWVKRDAIWVAKIGNKGTLVHLGSFKNEMDAARAYDKAAIKYHGEFARLNFPEGELRDGN